MKWIKSRVKYKGATGGEGEDSATISINQPQQTLSQANRIYFYSYVDNDSVLELNKQIDEASKQMEIVQITLDLPKPPPVKLYINSPGGEISAALCAADKISRSKVPIHTYCEGETASGATLMSVCGARRFMTKHSIFLIHQLSSDIWGKFVELKEEVQNLELMMGIIKDIYLSKTSIPEKELDDLLKHDMYLPPETCLQWKFVDEII